MAAPAHTNEPRSAAVDRLDCHGSGPGALLYYSKDGLDSVKSFTGAPSARDQSDSHRFTIVRQPDRVHMERL